MADPLAPIDPRFLERSDEDRELELMQQAAAQEQLARESYAPGEGMAPQQSLQPLPPQQVEQALQAGQAGDQTLTAPPPSEPAPQMPLMVPVTNTQTTTQRTPGVAPMPGYADQLGEIADAQRGAIGLQEQGALERSQQVQQAMAEHDAKLQAEMRAQNERLAEAEMRRSEEEAVYQHQREEAAKAKVDPDNYWSSKSGGRKVGLILAGILGAVGEAFTSGRAKSMVPQMIRAGIEQDIRLQEKALQRKKEQRDETRGVLSDLTQRVGSLQLAKQQARVMLGQDLQRRLATIAEQTRAPEIKARSMAAMAEVQKYVLGEKQRVHEMAQDRTVTSTTRNRQMVPTAKLMGGGAGAGKPMSAGQQEKLAEIFSSSATLEEYLTNLKKEGVWTGGLKAMIPIIGKTSSAGSVNDQRNMLVGAIVKSLYGGSASENDRMSVENAIPGYFETTDAAVGKIKFLQKQRLSKLKHLADIAQTPQERQAAMKTYKAVMDGTSKMLRILKGS